jgi:hypothetical protein
MKIHAAQTVLKVLRASEASLIVRLRSKVSVLLSDLLSGLDLSNIMPVL